MRAEPLEPRRIRYPKGAYGWVDLRIVTDGHLQSLDHGTALTYFFLCTVGNREGISFWSHSRMAAMLNLPPEAINSALQTLSELDLIAVADRVVQVLPVPARSERKVAGAQPAPNPTAPPPSATSHHSPVDTRSNVSEEEIQAHEAQARAQIARFYGARKPSPGVVRSLAQSLAIKSVDRRRP